MTIPIKRCGGWTCWSIWRDQPYALDPPVSLLAAVSQSVQPDQALRRLERFLHRAGGITALHHRTNDTPILGQQLAQILGYSGFLTDALMRDTGAPLLAAGRDDLYESAVGTFGPAPHTLSTRDG